MNMPRFLIAKYIPDLRRMEPRNIGVLVWTSRGTAARFIGERPDKNYEIDGRSIASTFNYPNGYRQWVGYWRAQLAKRPPAGFEDDLEQGECSLVLKPLLKSGRDNYILAEGGFLLDQLPYGDTPQDLADFLFESRVLPERRIDEHKDPTLQQIVDEILDHSQITLNPSFSHDFPISYHGRQLKFSHAFRNGDLSVFQKVSLPHQAEAIEKNACAAAWKFEKAAEVHAITKEHGYALVYIPQERYGDSNVCDAVQTLESVAQVVDLGDDEKRNRFENLLSDLAEYQTKHPTNGDESPPVF